MNFKNIVMVLCVLPMLAYGETRTLQYVIDGDTAVFSGGIDCRFAYVDTPESKPNAKAKRDMQADRYSSVELDQIIEAGHYAKGYTKSLLRKGMSYEIKIIGQDRYDRKICEIYADDGEMVNMKLVKNGFAVPFFKYIKNPGISLKMKANVMYAKFKEKGLWRTHRNVMSMMETADK